MIDDGRVRVILLEPDRLIASAVGAAVSAEHGFEVAPSVADEPGLRAAIDERAADVAVIDLAAAGTDPSALIRDVLARRPGTCVIATGRGTPAGTVGRVIASGAATFLPMPYRPDELISTIRELRGVPQRPAAPPATPQRRGWLIAAYSPKGGVGTTTVATSLAVALAARGGTRVAIVDLDLQFGDVGVALDLKGSSGIADLLGLAAPIDEAVVSDVFVRHASGVHALLAPDEPTDMGSIDVPEVVHLLDRLRSRFDYIVCDLWSSLEELALAVLRAADRVVLVTTPEVPSLRHVRRIMNATQPLLSSDRTVIVANRAAAKVGVSEAEIERSLGLPVSTAVPSDGVGVTRAINEGMSVMDPRGSVRVARAFRALAELLAKDLARVQEGATASAPMAASR